MDSASLLKQEINQTLEDLHDFAKWKLIVVSGLAAAAFGLTGSVLQSSSPWLLVFVPYACAYIDLNSYQYLLRIFLLAEVLRKHHADPLLQEYERQCECYRKKGFFNIGLFAQFGCSLAFSVFLPLLAIGRLATDSSSAWRVCFALAGWLIGLALVALCYRDFNRRRGMLGATE